ncbi:MAG TPA: F0F1 ATP synthase subunit A [Terriglobales bacterium]|nr:F0F1 ATP synthase subunit A [Terriglobales bacterium]
MPELLLSRILNGLLHGPVTALLNLVGIHPAYPEAPIPDHVTMQILLVIVLTILFVIIRSQLSVEDPSGLQHVIEGAYSFVGNLAHEIIGHGYEEFMPYLLALGIFILCANLMGLIPGLESPTANTVVPLGCALVTWFYYQSKGILKNGPIGYIKHFIGPQESSIPLFVRLFLPILMFPIEVCSHLARLLSLTVRLYANMFAGEMVTLIFFSLIPLGVPVIFEGLHIGVSFIQTYIFVLLACVYLGEATAHEH